VDLLLALKKPLITVHFTICLFFYNSKLQNLFVEVLFLQTKITKKESFDDLALQKYFAKFYKKLLILDESKHMSPLFSHSCRDLAAQFNICDKQILACETPSLSSTSSDFSFRNLYVSALNHNTYF